MAWHISAQLPLNDASLTVELHIKDNAESMLTAMGTITFRTGQTVMECFQPT